MPRALKRKTRRDELEHRRLYETAFTMDPASDEYAKVMDRIDQHDKILKRSSEKLKTFIPAAATVISVGAIYATQQFGGLLIPKVVEAITSRNQPKPPQD